MSKTKSISTNPGKRPVNYNPYTEIKSISIAHNKTESFSARTQNQVNFDHLHKNACEPLYVRKVDILTPTTYTSSLLYDCYAVVTDDTNDLSSSFAWTLLYTSI